MVCQTKTADRWQWLQNNARRQHSLIHRFLANPTLVWPVVSLKLYAARTGLDPEKLCIRDTSWPLTANWYLRQHGGEVPHVLLVLCSLPFLLSQPHTFQRAWYINKICQPASSYSDHEFLEESCVYLQCQERLASVPFGRLVMISRQ